jgi:hypothetical protein
MPFTMKHIQSTLEHLGRLRPARPNIAAKRDFSLRETIFFMAPKLVEMKELGFTSKELAAALAEQNIAIKAPTLNRYLSEYQNGREKETAAEVSAAESSALKTKPPTEASSVAPDVRGVSASGPSAYLNLSGPVSEDSGQ